jgi:hypothetical protein
MENLGTIYYDAYNAAGNCTDVVLNDVLDTRHDQHVADAASHLRHFGSASKNADSRLEGVGKILGIVVLAFIALRAGLAAVNVVQTAYNTVQAITDALMAANLVGLVVLAIGALAVDFVLAHNTLKPFHDTTRSTLSTTDHFAYDAAGNRTDVVLNGVLDTHHDCDAANQVMLRG